MYSPITRKLAFGAIAGVVAAGLAACTGRSSDSVTVDGDVAIAYVKRPVSALGNPTRWSNPTAVQKRCQLCGSTFACAMNLPS